MEKKKGHEFGLKGKVLDLAKTAGDKQPSSGDVREPWGVFLCVVIELEIIKYAGIQERYKKACNPITAKRDLLLTYI